MGVDGKNKNQGAPPGAEIDEKRPLDDPVAAATAVRDNQRAALAATKEAVTLNPEAMASEMDTFLRGYRNPVTQETTIDPQLRDDLLLVYRSLGEAVNELTYRFEMAPEIRALLDRVRESLEPGFTEALLAYCDELKQGVMALARDVQEHGIPALMNPDTGKRQEKFVTDLKAILEKMAEGQDVLGAKVLAGASPAYRRIDLGSNEALTHLHTRISGLFQAIGTVNEENQRNQLLMKLGGRGLKEGAIAAVIEDIQGAREAIDYPLLQDSLESLSGLIIENMLIREINGLLVELESQPEADITALREKLLRFIHYALTRNRSAVAGQVLNDWVPMMGYPFYLDYRHRNQPLGALKRLLTILCQTLRAMGIIQWVKNYLQASDI